VKPLFSRPVAGRTCVVKNDTIEPN